MNARTAVSLLRMFFRTPSAQRSFYLAGFGDGLIVGAVFGAVVFVLVKVL